MASCELLETCIFFNNNMADMPSTSEIYKKMYCQNDFEKCARHMIVAALGRGSVPSDLFPNQIDRATLMIKG